MPWRKLIDCCVREIVKDDFAKVGAVLLVAALQPGRLPTAKRAASE